MLRILLARRGRVLASKTVESEKKKNSIAASRLPKCISAVMQCALHYGYDLTSVCGIPRVRASRGKHVGNGAYSAFDELLS